MTDQTASLSLPRRVSAVAMTGRISDLPWPVFLYLFTVVIPISVDVGPVVLTTLRALLLVVVVPLTFQLLAGRYGRLRATDLLFMAFALWSAGAIGVNNPTRAVEFAGSTGLEFFGGYMMGRAFIRTPQDFMALARTLILFLLLTLPLAVFEALTGRALLLEALRSLPGLSTNADNMMEQRMGLFRAQLVFAHPIHYGLVATVAFSLAFVGLKGQTSTAWRYVSSALIGLCVFLSVSSGAFLALILQLILILWAAVFAGMRRRWHLLAGLLTLAWVAIDLLSTRSPIDVFMSYATFNSHTAYWRSIIFEWGMKSVWGSPIFGIGLNDWPRPWYMRSASVDNFWLLTTMRYGIPGLLLLAAGYAIGLAKMMRPDFSTDPMLRQLRLAWVFTFLGMTFTLCTVAIWTNVYSLVFFMFASGLWLTEVQPAGAPAAAPASPGRRMAPRRPAAPDPARSEPALPGRSDAPAMPVSEPRYTRFPPTARPPVRAPAPFAER
jgi:O-antigen ligase